MALFGNKYRSDLNMNPNFNGSTTPDQVAQGRWTFTQTQSKVLTRSFLVTGLSFIAIFLISYGLYEILIRYATPYVANILLIVSPIIIIIASIMGVFMRPKVSNSSVRFMISVISIYTIAEGVGFAALFYGIQYSVYVGYSTYNLIDIMFLFAISGLMFAGMAMVGVKLSSRATAKLGHFLLIASIVFIIFTLFFTLMFSFTVYSANKSQVLILAIVSVVSGLLNLGYIAYIVSVIKKSTEFLNLNSETGIKIKRSLGIYFGFWLLVNLVGLLRVLIQIYLMFK